MTPRDASERECPNPRCRHRNHDGYNGLCGSGDTPSGYACTCDRRAFAPAPALAKDEAGNALLLECYRVMFLPGKGGSFIHELNRVETLGAEVREHLTRIGRLP